MHKRTDAKHVRVCLIGAESHAPAEGMQNVFHSLVRHVGPLTPTLGLDARKLASGRGWERLRRFHPDVVHYVAGPSLASFVLTRLARTVSQRAVAVISSLHPVGLGDGRLVRFCKPDLILSQAEDSEATFCSWGIRTRFFPNGVDTRRFQPVDALRKDELRAKYRILSSAQVVLHVGHLKAGRNVQQLVHLTQSGVEVVVVGSPETTPASELVAQLEQAGVTVLRQYLPDIQEMYQLSDVYVFPTCDRNHCIETPLSVLEALACGIPVVTTRFGALPRLFGDSECVQFVDDCPQLPELVRRVLACRPTPQLVPLRQLDWQTLASQLQGIYGDLLAERAAI